MLENFIYAKQKSLFEKALNNGEVLDEAIVFIEDTKEIWNHGTYFGDIYKLNTPIEDLGTISQQLYDDLIDAINKEKLIIATIPGFGSVPCVGISLEGMIGLLISMHPLYSIILINEDRTYTINDFELPEFINLGDGSKFLADDGYYKEIEANIQAVDTTDEIEDVETNTYIKYVALTLTEELKALVRENIGVNNQGAVDLSNYYTKEEIDTKIGDINTILESIINGGFVNSIFPITLTIGNNGLTAVDLYNYVAQNHENGSYLFKENEIVEYNSSIIPYFYYSGSIISYDLGNGAVLVINQSGKVMVDMGPGN